MTAMDALKTMAGRWMDRHYLPPAELPSPLPQPRTALDDDLPPHSTPRPACTLMKGEQVYVASHWWARIERIERLAESQGPAQVLLHLESGVILGSRFDFVYVSRDEDEQQAVRDGQ